MELTAVVEAMKILPDHMHIWVMTDSAYVKNGITQSVENWISWKNSQGARVANKSSGEKLLESVNRINRMEWSWV
jgi:ribonuclease HI